MKGIIFNLLEDVVTQEYGEAAWDGLLDAAGVDGAYTAVGSYPDEEFVHILGRMPESFGTDEPELLRWFGSRSIPLLASRYPFFFDNHESTRSFLLTLNDIIHPEVRKLYPDAEVPVFDFDARDGADERRLVIGYRSRRRLCALAEGFVDGAATYYGETARIEHPVCMLRGDDRCELVCEFSRNGG